MRGNGFTAPPSVDEEEIPGLMSLWWKVVLLFASVMLAIFCGGVAAGLVLLEYVRG